MPFYQPGMRSAAGWFYSYFVFACPSSCAPVTPYCICTYFVIATVTVMYIQCQSLLTVEEMKTSCLYAKRFL